MDIPGFTAVRADCDRSTSCKRKGGVIILFFNQRWVNPRNVTVKEGICCADIELLSVGFHAFYAPREFPYTVVIVVYIPPRAAPTTACDVIRDAVARMQTQHPKALTAITGDFNHVSLSSCLTGFVQYVDCPTRGEKTLDLFYAHVKDAYSRRVCRKPSISPPIAANNNNIAAMN